MTHYLISFPGEAMQLSPEDFAAAGRDSRAVVNEMTEAGVLVFAGGINEDVGAALIDATGAETAGGFDWAPTLDGGFTVIDVATRDEAVEWSRKIAVACKCSQELREFMGGSAS
jgi:hypothetical protein